MFVGARLRGVDVCVLLLCVQEKGKYELITGQWKSSDDVINIYTDLLRSHPGLIGYVDPLHQSVSVLYSFLPSTLSCGMDKVVNPS